MSGIGPLGWSYSSSFNQSYIMRTPKGWAGAKKVKGGGKIPSMLGYALLRLMLGVDAGLIFELVGAYVLGQAGYKGYDFKTHKKGDAIVFIGCIGGIVMGLILIAVDYTIGNTPRFRDGPHIEKHDAKWNDETKKDPPTVLTIRNQAGLRFILWPILAVIGTIVGVQLWHLHANDKPGKRAGDRTATAAIVGAVGSAIVTSAPSIVQLLFVQGGGYKDGA